MKQCTIADNVGGGIWRSGDAVAVRNSIVRSNGAREIAGVADVARFGSDPTDLTGEPRAMNRPATPDSGINVLGLAVDLGAHEFRAGQRKDDGRRITFRRIP